MKAAQYLSLATWDLSHWSQKAIKLAYQDTEMGLSLRESRSKTLYLRNELLSSQLKVYNQRESPEVLMQLVEVALE